MVGFGNGDPNQAAWFLANTAHAIASLSNPFVSYLINFPDGANMMANTSTIAVGALFAPVTLGFGPIVSLNLVFITGVAATTWSYGYVARKMGLSLAASLMVGVLIGLAPIRIIHGQGQPFLIFAVGTPWLLYSIWKLVEGRARHLAAIAQAVFWVGWSALVSLERLFVLSIPIAFYVVLRMWSFRSEDVFRSRILTFTKFAGASILVLAWPLYEFAFGDQALHGPPHDWLMGYSSHVRDFVTAGPWMLVHGFGPSDNTTGFLAGNFTDASYVGIPMFLACAWGIWRLRNSTLVRSLAIAALAGLILSCGTEIAWTEDSWSIPGVYAALQHLPGFNSAHPLNFQIVSSIAMAIIIGLAVDDYLASTTARRWLVGAGVVIVALSMAPNQSFATTKVALKS